MEFEQRKNKAINAMRELGIFKPYIRAFQKEKKVCFFERCAGYWVDQEPEVFEKMKNIEKEHDCTVYAITHEFTEFGELWSFLIIPKEDEEDIETILFHGDYPFDYYAYAYVWNKNDESYSEFGDIMVRSHGGGIIRIG